MIEEFVRSWPLFQNTYATGWLIAALLSLFGVVVVAREQIFIGAAISQASTLGIALGMVISGAFAAQATWLESPFFLRFTAVAASIAAALITARGGGPDRESHEGITGWVFLVSSSLSVLFAAHDPHGLEEIHRVASSSIIGATGSDAVIFGVLALLTAIGLTLRQRRILLLALDPPMADAVGIRRSAWEIGMAAWTGIGIGLSISVAGMLYTFGCLVLPALAARSICTEVRQMFFVSPIVAIGCALPGFVLANYYDYPPAQMTVAIQAGALVLAWAVRRWRRS